MSEEPKALSIPDRMVNAAKGLLSDRLKGAAEFQKALAVAETSKGIVIADDDGARLNAEQTIILVKGQRAGDAAKKAVLEIPRMIVAAVNALYDGGARKIVAAIEERNRARLAWDGELERRRQAAYLEEQKAHLEATRAATDEDDFAPALDEPTLPPPPPKMVTTATGAQVTREILKAEIVNLADVDPAFVELRVADATAYFRRELKRDVAPLKMVSQKGDPNREREQKGVVIGGLRFWLEPSVQNRVGEPQSRYQRTREEEQNA